MHASLSKPSASKTPSSPEAVRHWSQRVLSRDGLECTLVVLGPGETSSCVNPTAPRAHLLFVIEGGITVATNDATFLVHKDGAIYLSARRENRITADAGSPAKLLRIDLGRRDDAEHPASFFPPPAHSTHPASGASP
jgi:mannose-6-phosphate isomerase-like protein (cupin superfamily)